jgi:hypothetical protein
MSRRNKNHFQLFRFLVQIAALVIIIAQSSQFWKNIFQGNAASLRMLNRRPWRIELPHLSQKAPLPPEGAISTSPFPIGGPFQSLLKAF